MPRVKVERFSGREYHQYSSDELLKLSEIREKAQRILDLFYKNQIYAFVHGSVARGDITASSDIDIHIPSIIPSFRLEILEELLIKDRRIIMGTPNSIIKGLLILDEDISITFPLINPDERDIEFYKFSGLLTNVELKNNQRVIGVSKKLLLIEPDVDGYWQSSIIGNIPDVMNKLSISQRIVEERIRVLSRRDQIGRTGVLINYSLTSDENFEQACKTLADKNPIVRRRYQKSN